MNELKKIIKNLSIKDGVAATIFLVIGILIVLNFLSYQIFFRFDLTENKDYSISKISKKTIRDLDNIVNVKVYFSKNLPINYLNIAQNVKDILEEYANYSGGRIKISFIDPSDSKEIKNELEKIGIPAIGFDVLKSDAFEMVRGYMGIALEYGDKLEVIPAVFNTDNLEYEMTLALKKLTRKEIPILGLGTGSNSINSDDISYALSALKKMYWVEEVDLKNQDSLEEYIETLLIIAPKKDFSEEELKRIDKFVMAGKPVVFLVDGVAVEKNLLANKNEIGLEKLFSGYGLKLNHDLVLDPSCARASFSQGFSILMVDYQFWPRILSDNFDKNNPMVKDLKSLTLHWASSVSGEKKEGLDVSYLAKTTPKAWTQNENFNLFPQENFRLESGQGQHNLALFASGKFKSPFEQGETENGKIILVGDSDFIFDSFLEQNKDNLIFFQNLIDGLSLEEDLMKIRSQGIVARPIKSLEPESREILRYANIFGMTILVLGFGLLRYFLRRKKTDKNII